MKVSNQFQISIFLSSIIEFKLSLNLGKVSFKFKFLDADDEGTSGSKKSSSSTDGNFLDDNSLTHVSETASQNLSSDNYNADENIAKDGQKKSGSFLSGPQNAMARVKKMFKKRPKSSSGNSFNFQIFILNFEIIF